MNSIVKTDSLLQVVFAELYAPDIVDSQRDFMTRDEIRKSCWGFMKSGRNEIDVEHDGVVTTCAVVESFIARDDDPVFVPGSWVLGVHVPETELWGRIEKGELNGLGLAAPFSRVSGDGRLDRLDIGLRGGRGRRGVVVDRSADRLVLRRRAALELALEFLDLGFEHPDLAGQCCDLVLRLIALLGDLIQHRVGVDLLD
jgi:hypothetical protein